MNHTKMGTKALNAIVKVILSFLLYSIPTITSAQKSDAIGFEYYYARTKKMLSASEFLGDFALKSKSDTIQCYYGFGSFRFHVVKTGVIDSITFTGDIPVELVQLGKNAIDSSQKFWVCRSCDAGRGQWLTIPVLVSIFTGNPCQPNSSYTQYSLFLADLFKRRGSDQIQVGLNEWLLAPIYTNTMK